MKKLTIITTTVGALATTALGLAGTAAAAPLGGSSASDTINNLRARGYVVEINGTASVPLARCISTGVHGLPTTAPGRPADAANVTTVYVDISCPDDI